MDFSDLALGRRDLTRLAAAGAAAAGLGAGAAHAVPTTPASVRRRLRREHGLDALDLPLADLPGTSRRLDGWRTPVIETNRFTVLGVTWRRGAGRVRARWRHERDGWTEWRRLPHLDHGPDADSPEAADLPEATDLVWTGACDAVQLEFVGDQRDPVLALLHPRRRPADTTATVRAPRARRADGGVPVPGLFYRRSWSPDPRLRDGRPVYNRRIRQVHVHHTVSSNDYRRGDVPGMIRAMYRYHTRSLGWSDLGYNFLVDRFGRLWEGRAGGPRRAVRGAHTLGFNHASVGVAAIGNFETAQVGRPMIRALVRLASWKLALYGGDPHRTVWVRSSGSDRFRDGALVELPSIDGHRDTNETACPGRHLYDVLPVLRRRTARRIRRLRP